jgi:hypothetical protein
VIIALIRINMSIGSYLGHSIISIIMAIRVITIYSVIRAIKIIWFLGTLQIIGLSGS